MSMFALFVDDACRKIRQAFSQVKRPPPPAEVLRPFIREAIDRSLKHHDEEVAHVAAFLEGMSLRLEEWAKQSQGGGWSTHQVDANRRSADECRMSAVKLRQLLARKP